jgi:hypothetical protein
MTVHGDESFTLPFLEVGKYEHYKGKHYEVIGVGLDSETLKPVIIYRPLYKTSVSYWVRPYEMFVEAVTIDGKKVERFVKINE